MGAIEKQIYSLVKRKNPGNPLAYVRDIVRPLSMDTLTQCIRNCNDCSIGNGVRSLPYGNYNGSILIIRDFVSSEDLSESYVYPYNPNREPDVQISDTFLRHGIDLDQTLWMHAVNCCPHEIIGKRVCPRIPNKTELTNCRVFSDFAIRSFAPVFIFLMGSTALSMFLDVSMNDTHGRIISIHGTPAMPIYSPEYLAMTKEKMPDSYAIYKRVCDEDIERAASFLKQEYPTLLIKEKKENAIHGKH